MENTLPTGTGGMRVAHGDEGSVQGQKQRPTATANGDDLYTYE